jgi:hypothetical protein
VSKWGFLALVVIVGSALGLIAIVVDSLKTNTLALMALVVLVVLPLGAVSVGMFWLMARSPRTQTRPRNDDQAIETDWRAIANRGITYPQAALPAPAVMPRKINVPVVSRNGSTDRGQTILSTSTESGELTCPLHLLDVAAQLLADGQQPTRASFNQAGIMSSSEISSAVDFLRAHGWVRPIPPNSTNSPARWVSGADPNALTEFVSTWST